jgi:hypothetical protein
MGVAVTSPDDVNDDEHAHTRGSRGFATKRARANYRIV